MSFPYAFLQSLNLQGVRKEKLTPAERTPNKTACRECEDYSDGYMKEEPRILVYQFPAFV